MALHKDLTGAELHEPKGVSSATVGSVYEANGAGSGTWVSRLSGLFNINKYWMTGRITDISTPSSRTYLYVPVSSQIFEIAAVLDGPITTANAILSIYVNGVLFGDSLTVNFSGSSAGQLQRKNIVITDNIAAGSVVEIRSDGASDTVTPVSVSLGLRQTA